MKKSIAHVIEILLFACVSGCATKTLPLNSSTGNLYRGKKITYSVHETQDFSAMTAGKAVFGGIGGVAMVSKGNQIIHGNDVPDPAAIIANSLVTKLATQYDLVVKAPEQKTASKKPAELAKEYDYADLVLDVQTFNWGISYLPMDWNSYRILYFSRLNLIDTKTSKVIASGSFKYDSKENGSCFSYEQLTGNNADGLKKELNKAEKASIEAYNEKVIRAETKR